MRLPWSGGLTSGPPRGRHQNRRSYQQAWEDSSITNHGENKEGMKTQRSRAWALLLGGGHRLLRLPPQVHLNMQTQGRQLDISGGQPPVTTAEAAPPLSAHTTAQSRAKGRAFEMVMAASPWSKVELTSALPGE